MEKQKCPEIRFGGFEGDWEESSLGSMTSCFSGGTPTAGIKQFYGGSIPFIRSGEISDDKTELFLTEDGLNNSSAKLVNKGDILFALYGATSGEVSRSKIDGAINQAILAIIPTQMIQPDFLTYWLRKSKSDILNTYLQGGQGNLSAEIVKNLIVEMPNFKTEQTAIGNFFQQLDQSIVLQQQKHTQTQNLKKAMLEKMFPKAGSKQPEIRIKGFGGDWEENELGNITTFINGRAYKQDELLKKGKYPVLRVGNFNTNSHWYFSDLELGEKYYAEQGDLLYTWSTAFSPYIWKGEKVIYHYHIWKIELSTELDKLFAFHFLKADEIALTNNTNGSTMVHVTKGEMESKTIAYPTLEEQTAIGQFFKQLDDTLALQQQQLQTLKNLKQAFLAKMFV